jgi:hypothetical protein
VSKPIANSELFLLHKCTHQILSCSHEKQIQKGIAKKQAEIEALMKQSEAKESNMAPTVHSDTSAAVKKALEASRVHGNTSVEARMAWEEVEEMDSANRYVIVSKCDHSNCFISEFAQ